MEKSKLKSFKPQINKDGVHLYYDRTPDDRKFKFTLEFENGDTGTAHSNSKVGNYEIGVEYVYNKEVTIHEDKTYTNFKGVKRVDDNFKKGFSGKSKEQFIAETALKTLGTAAAYPIQYYGMTIKEKEDEKFDSAKYEKMADMVIDWELKNIEKVVNKIKELL